MTAKALMVGAVAALLTLGAASADAAPGFVTSAVNLRSGPDTEFPSVEVIPEGAQVEVAGCLQDESWCDVIVGPSRGWVFSEYVAFEQRGEYVPLPDLGLGVFHIPVVRFAADDYWSHYYVSRPWYKDKARWIKFAPRPRPGWIAPPPGARHPGWWRAKYRAPAGMRPPPEHGWKRPHM